MRLISVITSPCNDNKTSGHSLMFTKITEKAENIKCYFAWGREPRKMRVNKGMTRTNT